MSEQHSVAEDDLPSVVQASPRRNFLPLVWLLPVVVVFVGLFVVIHARLSQGPTIEIQFHTAEGIEPGKTKIRFKDVEIGQVTGTRVTADRKSVLVTALLRKDASDYLVDDTRFWIVRPRISGGSVSGLGTILSGAYIGIDVGRGKGEMHNFIGLDTPPVVTSDVPGTQFVLHADQVGSLGVGSPLFYRRIEAGQVVALGLDGDGTNVTVRVFVNAPYDKYVTAATRFWQASGIDMSLSAEGVKIQTESLSSILEGGVAFEQSPSMEHAGPLKPNASFTLFADREHAMQPADTEVRPFVMYFKGTLRGLSVGAAVDLRGITIGEVRDFSVEYDRAAGVLQFPVHVDIYPARIRERFKEGAPTPDEGDQSEQAARQLIDSFVAHGMRAELKSANLLTGQQYVSMDFHADASKAAIDWRAAPPVFPTVEGGFDQIQDTIGDIAKKIDKLPFGQTVAQLNATMASLEATLKSTDHLMHQVDSTLAPQVNATLIEAQGALKNAKAVLAQDAPVQGEVRESLLQLSRAAKSVSELAEYLQQHPESLVRGKPEDQP